MRSRATGTSAASNASVAVPAPRALWLVVVPFLIAFVASLVTAPAARAEGSKELTAEGGNRAYLEWRNNAFTGGIARKTELKVYAQVGETINLGSSAAGVGSGTINYRRPNGTSGTCGATGQIANRTQENAGPAPNTNGYTPCAVTVAAGQGGVWEIDMVSPNPANTSNPAAIAAGSNWTQASDRSFVAAWDVTVRSSGGITIPGRAYTNYLSMNMGANNISFNPDVLAQTRDGYRYRIDPNGLDPFVFTLFANNKGFRNSGGDPLYSSVQLSTTAPLDVFQNGEDVHDPGSADTTEDVTHKLFFATPDSGLPASAPTPDGTTWLLVTPGPLPVPTNFGFTGSEGTPGQAGEGLGGSFSFDASAEGNYAITLDLNRDGVAGTGNDRILAGIAQDGVNSIVWDGRDADGAALPAGGQPFEAFITLQSGEVHFPVLDAENNPNGLKITRLLPTPTNDTIYYDDRGLSGGTPPSPLDARTGVSSTSGAHGFSGTFGDHKGIDSWAYAASQEVQVEGEIQVATADLSVTKTDNRVRTLAGQSTSYDIEVTNDGPSAANRATFSDTVPSGITGVTWDCSVTSGTGSCGTASGSGNNVATTLDLEPGATATITVSGTVADDAPATLSNTATVTRPDDVADPDASNDAATDTTAVDHPPTVVLDGPDTVDESPAERTYSFSVTDVDAGDTFSVVGTPTCGAGGAYVAGSLTTNPTGGSFRCLFADGPASGQVQVDVSDSTSLTGEDTKTVSVDNVAPIVTPPADPAIDEGATTSIDLGSFADPGPDGDWTTTVDWGDGSPETTFTSSTPGSLPQKPHAYEVPGTYAVTVTVAEDGGSPDGSASFDVTVLPVNDAPSFTKGADESVDEDSGLQSVSDWATDISPGPADESGQELAFEVSGNSNPSLFSAGPAIAPDGTLTYTPAADAHGVATVSVLAKDDGGIARGGQDSSAPQSFTITVGSVNDAPVGADDQKSTPEGTPLSFPASDLTANDSEGPANEGAQNLTVAEVSDPEYGTVELDGPNVTFTPEAGYNGPASFRYRVCDDGAPMECTTDVARVDVTVTPVNSAPVAADDQKTMAEDASALAIDLRDLASDGETADGDLTYSIVSGPSAAQGTIGGSGAQITFTPAPNYSGTVEIHYRVVDRGDPDACGAPGTGCAAALDDEGIVTIEVEAVNDAPTANDDRATTPEDTPKAIDVLDNDSDLEASDLVVSGHSSPSHGTVDCTEAGVCTYTPDEDYAGEDSFTYTVTDADGGTATARVTVTVEPVNDPPSAREDRVSTSGGGAKRIDVLGNDSDSEGSLDRASVTIVDRPSGGSVTVNPDGSISYTPDEDFSGVDSFTYRVCEQGESPECATATVVVTVSGTEPRADLSIEKTGPASVTVGGELPYTLRVRNRGPATATGVVVRDQLPQAVSYRSASPGCTYRASNRTVTCRAAALADGAAKAFRIVVRVSGDGPIVNRATVTSTVRDPAPGNGTDTARTQALPLPTECEVAARGRTPITGTPGNDIIRGTSGDDVIVTGGGRDLIRAGDGDDVVCAGDGQDVVWGDDGDDLLLGQGGDDALRGGRGNDTLKGARGDDQLVGGAGRDRLIGWLGKDDLTGQGGNDFLDARDDEPRNDVANGGDGRDTCLVDPKDAVTSCE